MIPVWTNYHNEVDSLCNVLYNIMIGSAPNLYTNPYLLLKTEILVTNLTHKGIAKQAGVSRGYVCYDRCPMADLALGCKDIQPEPVKVVSGQVVEYYRAQSG